MAWNFGLLGAAAGGAPAFDFLETTRLSSDASSIELTNLNLYSDYKHLQLRISGKDGYNWAGTSYLKMNFNQNASGGLYHTQQIYAWQDAATLRATSSTGNNSFTIEAGFASDQSGNTNQFSQCIIDIYDFADTNKATTFKALSFANRVSSSGTAQPTLTGGVWGSTDALTQISLASAVGANVKAKTSVSLYGWKG